MDFPAISAAPLVLEVAAGDDEVGDDEVGDDEVGDDEVGDDEVGDDEVGVDEVGVDEVGVDVEEEVDVDVAVELSFVEMTPP